MKDAQMQQLQQLLAERNNSPQRAMEIDAQIWSLLGVRCAVLVSDMSGFTRTTKEYGIVHFLAMHHRTVELSIPGIESEQGTLIKKDADNLIATFSTPTLAVRAAMRMQRDVAEYNRTVDYSRQVGICIGISFGEILRTGTEAFGDAVNIAYKLGEDIADPWDILVSDSAIAEIFKSEDVQFEFKPREEVLTNKVRIGFHRVVYLVQ